MKESFFEKIKRNLCVTVGIISAIVLFLTSAIFITLATLEFIDPLVAVIVCVSVVF